MNFKKNALAICVLTGAISVPLHAYNQVDSVNLTTQESTSKVYTLYLQEDLNTQTNSNSSLKTTIKNQDTLLKEIQTIDATAQLVSRSSLIANVISVKIDPTKLDDIKRLEKVKYTFEGSNTISHKNLAATHSTNTSTTNFSITAESELTELTPYTGDSQAGVGVSIAILSTGIDYTLPIFGGSGEYGEDNDPETPPTAGSYLEALENGAIAFDGFPTEVVAGGWDFASENYGNDANPIDQNLNYERYDGWVYPTGLGTGIASIVHQLAPGAKLHAYKIYNVSGASWDPSYIQAQAPTFQSVVNALEHAVDPNQDGDTSDHLDILLLDANGASAFFDIDGSAGLSLLQLLLERVSALGTTIVTHAGNSAESSFYADARTKHRSWISNEGSATSVITIGSVEHDEDGLSSSLLPWSPMGPVRGSSALKPELVTQINDQTIAKISSSREDDPKMGIFTEEFQGYEALASTARIAAAAAVIKSKHPSFGPLEIKALLANTADINDIFESDGITTPEIYSVGHGIENLDNATSSPIVAWEKESKQPYVQFGMHEVADKKIINKHITLRNLSDSVQTYTISYNMNGDKAAHDALTFTLPEVVSVPANTSVSLPVTLAVDSTKLPNWPIMNTLDHTDENLKQTELNGYIQLKAEGHPTLNLGWIIKARNKTEVIKKPIAEEFPIYLGWNSETQTTDYEHLVWAQDHYSKSEYVSYVASFINDSNSPTTFQAYPLLLLNQHEDAELEAINGHKIHAVGGGVFEDASCSITGQKLNIAVSFFQPADVAIANYFDKIGERLFYYDLFSEDVVLDNGWNESFDGAFIDDESLVINQPFVAINENGQPTTYVIDYTKEYDYTNPTGRFKESSLPTYFTNNGKNVVSQVCLEDLFHHKLSENDFDQNMGFHIETDRDVGRDKYEPIIQFNPIQGGYHQFEEQCYFDFLSGRDICTETLDDRSIKIGFAAKEADSDVTSLDFSQTYEAQPGEEIYIASASTAASFIQNGTPEPKGFMVVSLNDDYMEIGYNQLLDDDGNLIPKVKSNQEFYLMENTEVGTVVGKLELDTQGFYTAGTTKYETLYLYIVNILEGTPFAIDQETHEIYVVNPDVLDFENVQEFNLTITTQLSNNIGEPTLVKITMMDENDVAPAVNDEIANSLNSPSFIIEKGDTANFSIDISGLFSDLDNESLSLQVQGEMFNSLSISNEIIEGAIDVEGNHSITITATDGVYEASYVVNVEVTYEEKKNSGSFGLLSLLFVGLISIRKKLKQ